MIKEYAGRVCVIREDNYGRNLTKFLGMIAEAKRDFPELVDEAITIEQYGGDRIKHQFGIEFVAPDGSAIPEAYKPIRQLHPTL